MFYTERFVRVPLTNIELPIPGTRKVITIGTRYTGIYGRKGEHPIRTTVVLTENNHIHHLDNPQKIYGPEEIRRLRIGPEPKGPVDRLFPIRLRSV